LDEGRGDAPAFVVSGRRKTAASCLMSLRQQLDFSARYDAEYSQNLSSHLPMALLALARLGASETRLAAFAERYATRLRPAPAAEPWPGGEAWQSRLGDPRAWPAYRSLFNEWIDHEGAPAVLAQALPALLRGVGAAAFHGLIRSAYALEAGHSHELADALAYWACRWFALGDMPAGGRQQDPATVLAALQIAKPKRPLIAERMALVAEQRAFMPAAAGLQIDRDATLAQLATLAARLYAASDNFTVLHLVTSAHAMRVLLPWLEPDEQTAALGHYWLAFAAGYAASGLNGNGRSTLPSAPLKPWPALIECAVASDDDHLIKLIDSCREQERAYGGALWREAASRAVASA
jgi:hypothetical protein